MKKKIINEEHIEGRVYSHNLVIKTVQNKESNNFGKEYISGSLDVATDEGCLNVITVHFTYVTEMTAKNKKNFTYTALKTIIDENKTCLEVGNENAMIVSIDTALALNDFYSQTDGRMISQKRNEGGFVSIIKNGKLSEENKRNTFTADMVITNVSRVEADPEKNIENDYAIVKGAIFNFKAALLPVEFKIVNEEGINFFENYGATPSNPVFTKVWGKIVSSTIKITKTEESGFGEAKVQTTEKKTKDWVITGTSTEPYEFGNEEFLTAEELKKAMQDREIHLAEVKKNSDEYAAKSAVSKSIPSAAPAMDIPTSNFQF